MSQVSVTHVTSSWPISISQISTERAVSRITRGCDAPHASVCRKGNSELGRRRDGAMPPHIARNGVVENGGLESGVAQSRQQFRGPAAPQHQAQGQQGEREICRSFHDGRARRRRLCCAASTWPGTAGRTAPGRVASHRDCCSFQNHPDSRHVNASHHAGKDGLGNYSGTLPASGSETMAGCRASRVAGNSRQGPRRAAAVFLRAAMQLCGAIPVQRRAGRGSGGEQHTLAWQTLEANLLLRRAAQPRPG